MDEHDEHDEHEEQEHRIFTLNEAEQTRRELEPVLIELVEQRRKAVGLQQDLAELAARIMMSGGMTIPYADAARRRAEHDKLMQTMQAGLEQVHSTGCVVKDLDQGLIDFPAIVNNQEVYLCWRLGEDRIRFYHGHDEGFAGRKLLDPRDSGNPLQ